MPYLMGAPFLPTPDATAGGPAASLASLNFRLPFTSTPNAVPGTTCLLQTEMSATMGGEPGSSYDVTFHVVGIVEMKGYTGGSNDGGRWQIGGTPSADTWNIYKVSTSSPAQEFYVNKGTAGVAACFTIDYYVTVQIDAGSLVTFAVNSIASGEIWHNQSFAGVTDPSQPYPGQWVNVTVTGVTKR